LEDSIQSTAWLL